jgi:hypothetical protein
MTQLGEENAVRTYLRLVRGDHDVSLPGAMPSDPLERLRVRAEAERSFVAHAKTWADRHRISAAAFLEEGVPGSVLKKAGFRTPRAITRPQEPVADADTPEAHIQAAMPSRQPFTVDGLAAKTGESRSVVRRMVEKAVKDGKVGAIALSGVEGRADRASVLYRRL